MYTGSISPIHILDSRGVLKTIMTKGRHKVRREVKWETLGGVREHDQIHCMNVLLRTKKNIIKKERIAKYFQLSPWFSCQVLKHFQMK